MTMKKIGTAGVTLIKGFEGFSSKPYRDAVGVGTIAYGHTKGHGDIATDTFSAAAHARLAIALGSPIGSP